MLRLKTLWRDLSVVVFGDGTWYIVVYCFESVVLVKSYESFPGKNSDEGAATARSFMPIMAQFTDGIITVEKCWREWYGRATTNRVRITTLAQRRHQQRSGVDPTGTFSVVHTSWFHGQPRRCALCVALQSLVLAVFMSRSRIRCASPITPSLFSPCLPFSSLPICNCCDLPSQNHTHTYIHSLTRPPYRRPPPSLHPLVIKLSNALSSDLYLQDTL